MSRRGHHVINVGWVNVAVGACLKHGPLKRLVDEGRFVPRLRNRKTQSLVASEFLVGGPELPVAVVDDRVPKTASGAGLRIEEAVLERKAGGSGRGPNCWKRKQCEGQQNSDAGTKLSANQRRPIPRARRLPKLAEH